jgi:hypothetical protein
MQQSNDSLQGLDYMIQLRDKLCKGSAEAVAMDRAITRYQNAIAQVELREALVYTAPKDFHPMFVEELEAEQRTRKENNKLYKFWQYALFTGYGLFVLYFCYDIIVWSPK